MSVSSVASWQVGVLDPQGPIAAAERTILFNATVIMLAVVVPVILGTLAFAWWFRAGNRWARRRADWAYSGPIEITVWSIPVLVILFLGGIAWVGSHDLDPRTPIDPHVQPIEIQVVSLDWKWLFIYPQAGIASVNHLIVPAGVPLRLSLTSAGVMNSFLAPQLGSQIYTMAGMTTVLNLKADSPGIYPGLSAQFSGDGFSDMRFDVIAVTEEKYAQWQQQMKSVKARLDAAHYADLSRPGTQIALPGFGAVDKGLFDHILKSSAE